MRQAKLVIRGLVLGVALAGTAAAQGVGPSLTIGTGGSITSLDPHFFNASPNNALANHVFDRLVDRDARARLVPGLAESWRAVDDLTAQGRDSESQVLARAVKWHSEHRVLVNGHKTVIFR